MFLRRFIVSNVNITCSVFNRNLLKLESHVFAFNLSNKNVHLLATTHLKVLNAYEKTSDYIKKLQSEYDQLENKHQDSSTIQTDRQLVVQRLRLLNQIFDLNSQIVSLKSQIDELETYIKTDNSDDELTKIAKEDLQENSEKLNELKFKFIELMVGEEPEDQENAYLELNAGVGGQEAMLFCDDLYNMYKGYANYQGWSFQNINIERTELGGVRHATVDIKGNAVFKYLKFESGVHRVQRVPKTERTGRIHTSTVAVVILPKPEEIKIELNPKDLKIEQCRSQGPGGQHVNKTESAIRITHLPTNTVVFCQEERHSHQNRKLALDLLKYKLYQKQFEETTRKREQARQSQVSSAARSERIRTYNFIQDRISDHRLADNVHNITDFLLGNKQLDQMILSLKYEKLLDLLFNEIIK